MTTEEIRGDSTVPPTRDFASHLRQYRRFLHLTKWFVIHLVALLPALYFLVVVGQPVAGVLFLALALGALAYGIISTPSIARDLKQAVSHESDGG